MNIKESALALNDHLIALRRELHAIPELEHELPQTAAVVTRELSKLNLDEVKTSQGRGYGVYATLKGGKPGKTLALRADMDALPIKEATGLPFASSNGNMHACGHDAHTAMLLTVAKILAENRQELEGTIRFIFQPAEETVAGAVSMIESGALENPKVDAIIGIHTGSIWGGLSAGQLGWRVGPMMASTSTLKIVLEGKGGHGATPQYTIDPVVMAAEIITQLQTLVSREISPFEPAVVTIGKIMGGTAHNIIADRCELWGTIRNFDKKIDTFLKERIKVTAEGVAASMRGRAEVEFSGYLPPVLNDEKIALKMRDIASKVLGPDQVKEVALPSSGAEDFACYLEKIPGAFFYHCALFGDERDYPHHNARFDLNEAVLWSAVAGMAAFAFDWQK